MKTYILQGTIHATTQISHNGGEINGNVAMFRRMGVVQKDGTTVEVPYISGNSVRGKLRDISAASALDLLGSEEQPQTVSPQAFQLLFSGGTLTSGNTDGDIDAFRNLKADLPHVSLFGGAYGNSILAGAIKVNPLIPIAKETKHLIPDKYLPEDISTLPSVHEYLQLEMFTRRENLNDAGLQKYLNKKQEGEADQETSQMIYHVETMKAGTPFYWQVVLEDVTDKEFGAFLTALANFNAIPVIGGKGAVGLGQVNMGALDWTIKEKTGNQVNIDRNLSTASVYETFMQENKESAKKTLAGL